MAIKKNKKKKQAEQLPIEDIFVSYRNRVTNMSSSKAKSLAIIGLVLSVLLIGVSSWMYVATDFGPWIPALIGSPAGILLFLVGLGLVYRTNIKEWPIFQLRESRSFRQRLRVLLVVFAAMVLIFIPFGRYFPYGLGGAILISVTLTAVATARRTPYELKLAEQGLPDPRDIAEAEAKDKYATEDEEVEEEPTADTVYYDEERGSFGGKIN